MWESAAFSATIQVRRPGGRPTLHGDVEPGLALEHKLPQLSRIPSLPGRHLRARPIREGHAQDAIFNLHAGPKGVAQFAGRTVINSCQIRRWEARIPAELSQNKT